MKQLALTVLHSQAPQLHLISFGEPALMHCEWDKIAHDQSEASYLQCDSWDPGSDFRNSSVDLGLYQILLIKIQTLNLDVISLPPHFESYLSATPDAKYKTKGYKSYNSTKNWFQWRAKLLQTIHLESFYYYTAECIKNYVKVQLKGNVMQWNTLDLSCFPVIKYKNQWK